MTVQRPNTPIRPIKIETATLDSAATDIHAAPFWRRLAGDAIDLLVMLGIARLLWASPHFQTTSIVPAHFDQVDAWAVRLADHPGSLLPWIVATFGFHFFVTYVARRLWSASVGERIVGLSLLPEYRDSLTIWHNVIHYVLTIMSCLLGGLGYLWALYDRRRQTLANYGTATLLVIR